MNYDIKVILKYNSMYKYCICIIMGSLIKLYDDLDELFFYKNKKIIECVKIVTLIVYCYYLFVIQSNIYDILWILYFWAFVPIFYDWNAFMIEPYFFGFTICISLLCLFIIYINSYTISIFYLCILLPFYTICSPFLEYIIIDTNSQIAIFLKKINFFKNKSFIINLTKTEREVSFTKLVIRIINLLNAILILIVFSKYKSMFGDKMENLILSGVQFSYFWIGYFIVSILNQSYVLYVDPIYIELHKKINNEI